MQYDEITYGERIKTEGFQTDNIKAELIILSKYLFHIDKLKPKPHKEFVYEFCKTHISDFNEVKHYKIIDSCIRKGRDKEKYPIRVKSIPIYKEDLRKIDSCDVPDDYKKVMLAMLVERMLNAEKKSQRTRKPQGLSLCYYGNNKTNKLVFNSSRIGSTYKIKNVLRDLNQSGVIHDVGRNRMILKFAEEIERDCVFYNLQSCDFDKAGWLWDYYKSQNKTIVCRECNVLLRRKGNQNTIYCATCKKDVKNAQNREYRARKT